MQSDNGRVSAPSEGPQWPQKYYKNIFFEIFVDFNFKSYYQFVSLYVNIYVYGWNDSWQAR